MLDCHLIGLIFLHVGILLDVNRHVRLVLHNGENARVRDRHTAGGYGLIGPLPLFPALAAAVIGRLGSSGIPVV